MRRARTAKAARLSRLWHRVSLRFALIVILAVVLTSGFSLYTALDARRQAIAEITDSTLRLARSAALFEADVVDQTRATLFVLGSIPAVRSGDWNACGGLLATELRLRPLYTNFAVADPHGAIVCSARPHPEPVNISDRSYFVRAMTAKSFSMGETQVGRITGTPAINFASPVFDAAGRVRYVVFAALDLTWFSDLADRLQLPPGGILSVFNADGVMVVGYPDARRWAGRRVPYADAVSEVLRRGSVATERVGLDGVRRIYGITRLSVTPAYANSYLSVGIPVAPALAVVRHQFLTSLTWVGIIGLFTVLMGLGGAAFYVQRPLDALTGAAKRLAAGDLGARAGSTPLGGELRPVIDAFDEMASALERRTAALLDAQAQYRALVEQSLAGVAVLNSERVLYANDAVAKILGYTPEELIGRPGSHWDLVHPEDRALAVERLGLRLADDHDPVHYTLRFIRKDGSIVYAEVFGRSIAYQGQPAVIATVLDISARVQAEAALRASEESYRSLVDRVPVGLFRTDANGRILQLNPAGLEIIGCPDMETAARLDIADLYVDPEDRNRWRAGIRQDGVVDNFEFRMRRADGSVIWVRDRARTVRDGRGELLYFDGFLEDVTRQRQAVEERARRAAEREAFHDLSVGLRSARTPRDMYPIILEQSRTMLGAAHVELNLLDADRRQFVRVDWVGVPYGDLGPVFPAAESCSGQVVESGTSRVSPDMLTDYFTPGMDPSQFTQFGPRVIVPVRTENEAIGTLVAVRLRDPDVPFTEAEVRLLEGIAEIGGIAIRRAELAESLARRVGTLTALYGSAQRLAGSLDPDQLAVDVVRTCVESFGLRMASLAYCANDDTAVMAAHYPPDAGGVQTVDGGVLDFRQVDAETCRAVCEAESPVIRQLAGDRDHPAWESAALVAGMRGAAFFPLITRATSFGFLVLYSDQAGHFTTERVEFLTAFAHQAAAALQNARLFDDAERRLRELQALNDIDRAVRGSLDLPVILQVLLDKAQAELKVDAVHVLLLDPDTQLLSSVALRGFRTGAVRHIRLRVGEYYAGQVALTGRPVSVERLDELAEAQIGSHVKGEGFVSYHAVPLVAKGTVRGVLAVLNRSVLKPTPEWHAFFEALAGQAATAIDNVTLFDGLRRANVGLRRSYDETIEGWSRALDLRDRETEGHSQRVAGLTIVLARAMGVQDADLVHIRRGALLHDIGKMGVPDAILLKAGPLTDAEWKTMRHHPEYARDLLEPIAYLHQTLDIPYGHHEWWDGTGYPQGLSGHQIPLAARIFTVVDVWDALRSDRPYRPAWSVEKVRAYVQEQAGRQFDPAVVGKFLELLDRGALSELAPAATPRADLPAAESRRGRHPRAARAGRPGSRMMRR